MKRNDDDPDLLPPSIDPDKLKIGIRQVTMRNEATARSVMTVRGHTVITDEPGDGDTGPTPLETTLSALPVARVSSSIAAPPPCGSNTGRWKLMRRAKWTSEGRAACAAFGPISTGSG